jgi:hypothetical protein
MKKFQGISLNMPLILYAELLWTKVKKWTNWFELRQDSLLK